MLGMTSYGFMQHYTLACTYACTHTHTHTHARTHTHTRMHQHTYTYLFYSCFKLRYLALSELEFVPIPQQRETQSRLLTGPGPTGVTERGAAICVEGSLVHANGCPVPPRALNCLEHTPIASTRGRTRQNTSLQCDIHG